MSMRSTYESSIAGKERALLLAQQRYDRNPTVSNLKSLQSEERQLQKQIQAFNDWQRRNPGK